MKCPSDTLIKENQTLMYPFNTPMSAFLCFENKRNVLNLLVYTQHKFSALEQYCGTMTRKPGILFSFPLCSMKNSNKS